MDENLAKHFFKQLITGIGYIHHKKILHRDIKLENILIDNLGELKITGFGLSKEIKDDGDKVESKLFGTPEYLAPETL